MQISIAILRLALVASLTAGWAGCSNSNKPADKKTTVEARATPWSVTYSDGSANGFRFWQENTGGEARFEYTPVQPAMSSSGIYSGGSAKQGTLDSAQVDELWRLVKRMESDESLHATARKMGTGVLEVTTPKGKREFIVERGPALVELDEFVKPFRGQAKPRGPTTLPGEAWSKEVGGLQVQLEIPDAAPQPLDAAVKLTLRFRSTSATPLRLYMITSEPFRSFQSHFRLRDPAGKVVAFQPRPRPHGYVVTEKDFHLLEPGSETSFDQSVFLSSEELGSADAVTVEWTYENKIDRWQGGLQTLDGKTKKLFGGKTIPHIWLGKISTSGTIHVAR